MKYRTKISMLLLVALVAVQQACAAADQSLNWSSDEMWYGGASRLSNVDESAPDVFYLLPTCVSAWTDSAGVKHYNADPMSEAHRKAWKLSAELADNIFASRANLFLPYYRQATFGGLEGEPAKKAGATALRDALDAFDYYMKHYNHGRPFVLAGYSQGGMLVKEVLKHMSDDDYSHLVAAYVVGYGVTAQDTVTQAGHRTSHVKLATDAASRGVTVAFNSVTAVDAVSHLLNDGNIACINPVSWTTDSTPAVLLEAGAPVQADDARFNYGTAVVPSDASVAVTVSVEPSHHVLVVKGIDANRYYFAALSSLFPVGNLHLQELFFYGKHLQENVQLRCGCTAK